jgi:hypothetical protein
MENVNSSIPPLLSHMGPTCSDLLNSKTAGNHHGTAGSRAVKRPAPPMQGGPGGPLEAESYHKASRLACREKLKEVAVDGSDQNGEETRIETHLPSEPTVDGRQQASWTAEH